MVMLKVKVHKIAFVVSPNDWKDIIFAFRELRVLGQYGTMGFFRYVGVLSFSSLYNILI